VQWVIEELSVDPTGFFVQHYFPAFTALGEALARHVNAATPAEIVIIPSTSAGLNAVAQAIEWRAGDNVLFCDLEFPSNAFPWMSLERDGVRARCVPVEDGGMTVERVEEFSDGRTRAVAVSALQFFSGQRADLAAIGGFCRAHGILFIVDAIQSIGHIPIDVQAMNIDVLASGGMKSLLGLPGAGFMYVREAVAETMRPRLILSGSTVDYAHWLTYNMTPAPGAARLGGGAPNVPGVMALVTSLALLTELGLENIDAYTTGLTRYAAGRLADEGYKIITPLDAAGPILTFRSPHDSAVTDRLVAQLAERGVVVAKHLDAEGAAHVRLSFHCYNVPAEIDRAVEEIGAFVS
jgi:selenocysteine lyase/cysteine desulfurase